MLVLYAVTRWQGGSVAPEELDEEAGPARRGSSCSPTRPSSADELHEALHRIEGSEQAEYFVVVPANPVDTGEADREGAAFVWEATDRARPGAARRDPRRAA